MTPLVLFSHGKESGPQGSKIQALREIADEYECPTLSIDYRGQMNPEDRVVRLTRVANGQGDRPLILVGSSMGGYASIVASTMIKPQPLGIFLMAPAVYLPGYNHQDLLPMAMVLTVVHGNRDAIVPPKNVYSFVNATAADLHMVDDDHGLEGSLDLLKGYFADFMTECLRMDPSPG